MTLYDYKVIPAPSRGVKAKGVKTADARFAHAVELSLNALAAEGWEFHRAETLPSEERQGLTGSTTSYRSLLVFRRARPQQGDSALEQTVGAPDAPPVASAAEPDRSPQPAAAAASLEAEDDDENVTDMSEVLRDRVAKLMDPRKD